MNQIQAKQQVLPALAMLIKLINRKQSGSRPFSDSFNYDTVIKFLDDKYQDLTNSSDAACDIDFLSQAADIAKLARVEVTNAGLKNDYYWIEETFKLVKDAMVEK